MKFKYLLDPIFLGSLFLYIFSKFIMLDNSNIVYNFWNYYLSDILLVPVALPILLFALRLIRIRKNDLAPNFLEILIPLIVWSITFEIVAPLFVSSATGDFFDILAYTGGGLISWYLWNYKSISKYFSSTSANPNKSTKILISIISLYQNIAPSFIRRTCGFTPTCSEYGKIALKKYGTRKGIKMTFLRLMRCMPNRGGIDYP